jgi:hypothetical protein
MELERAAKRAAGQPHLSTLPAQMRLLALIY